MPAEAKLEGSYILENETFCSKKVIGMTSDTPPPKKVQNIAIEEATEPGCQVSNWNHRLTYIGEDSLNLHSSNLHTKKNFWHRHVRTFNVATSSPAAYSKSGRIPPHHNTNQQPFWYN